MRKLLMSYVILAVCALGGIAATAAEAAANHHDGDGLVVTFQKTLVDPANLVFQGTTGGSVPGALTSRLVPGSLTIAGTVWTFTFDWIVTADSKHKSFVAETTGVFDTVAGTVVMDGSVVQGFHRGAPVHEEGVLTDRAAFSFAGRIVIGSANHDEDRD